MLMKITKKVLLCNLMYNTYSEEQTLGRLIHSIRTAFKDSSQEKTQKKVENEPPVNGMSSHKRKQEKRSKLKGKQKKEKQSKQAPAPKKKSTVQRHRIWIGFVYRLPAGKKFVLTPAHISRDFEEQQTDIKKVTQI